MTQLISAFWMLLELLFYQYFWQWFFSPKVSKKKYQSILLINLVGSMVLAQLNLPQIFFTCFFIIYHTAFCSILLTGKWYQHAVVVLLSSTLMGVLEGATIFGASVLLHISVSQISMRKTLYIVLLTTVRFLVLFLGWAVLRLKGTRSIRSIEVKWFLLSALFPLLSFSMLLLVFYMNKDDRDLSTGTVVFFVILIAINLATIYLISQMERIAKESKEQSLMNQQRQLQTEHILTLEKSYREQRKATHEFRNRMQTLSDLLAMGQVEQAQAYLVQMQETQTTRIFCTDSGNPVIDAILNHKNQVAKDLGIDIQVQLNNLSRINIAPDTLTMLLCNLLDNAIEGCCRVEGNRQILCKLIAGDSFLITIKNTSIPVTIQDGKISSSKTPREEHGYGIPRIQYILNQLGGEYAFDYQEGWFTFAAEIPLKGK